MSWLVNRSHVRAFLRENGKATSVSTEFLYQLNAAVENKLRAAIALPSNKKRVGDFPQSLPPRGTNGKK